MAVWSASPSVCGYMHAYSASILQHQYHPWVSSLGLFCSSRSVEYYDAAGDPLQQRQGMALAESDAGGMGAQEDHRRSGRDQGGVGGEPRGGGGAERLLHGPRRPEAAAGAGGQPGGVRGRGGR